MKSSIKIDTDFEDRPIIKITSITSSDDLRDKALASFLRKLGFKYILQDSEETATLEITCHGCGAAGLNSDTYELFTVRPVPNSATKISKE
jgi:hypothetical protein